MSHTGRLQCWWSLSLGWVAPDAGQQYKLSTAVDTHLHVIYLRRLYQSMLKWWRWRLGCHKLGVRVSRSSTWLSVSVNRPNIWQATHTSSSSSASSASLTALTTSAAGIMRPGHIQLHQPSPSLWHVPDSINSPAVFSSHPTSYSLTSAVSEWHLRSCHVF